MPPIAFKNSGRSMLNSLTLLNGRNERGKCSNAKAGMFCRRHYWPVGGTNAPPSCFSSPSSRRRRCRSISAMAGASFRRRSTPSVARSGRPRIAARSFCASTPAAACGGPARLWPRRSRSSACGLHASRSAGATCSPSPVPRRCAQSCNVQEPGVSEKPFGPVAHDKWLSGARAGAGHRHEEREQPPHVPGEGVQRRLRLQVRPPCFTTLHDLR